MIPIEVNYIRPWCSENFAWATGIITIDRTLYDIKYKSKSYFPDIGDKFIYDDFKLYIKIEADRVWDE